MRHPKAALFFDDLEASDIQVRREVLQHFRVLLDICKFATSRQPLTEDDIAHWHRSLMEELVHPCGTYRKEGVVAGQKVFPNHELVPDMMASFVSQLNSRLEDVRTATASSYKSSIWAISAWASHALVAIHPFIDGNGRMSRLLANYVLSYCGFPFIVSLACSRKKYIQALRYADRDFGERRTGKLALVILSNAYAICENFRANLKLQDKFSSAPVALEAE